MARPQKMGLDYFPFDVGLLRDNKLRRPKMKYGYLATSIYLALLTLLYSDKGYYIPYATQNNKNDCIWYIQECLQGKYQPDADMIADVIEELVACELFSGDHYPENITSKRSQSVYYSATVERKTIVIEDTIWMLSLEEMKNLSEKHIYYLSKVRQLKNGVYRPINPINRPNNPQSKEKESKVYIETTRARENSEFKESLESFCQKFDIQIDTNSSYIAEMDFDKLSQAYDESKTFLQNRAFAKCLSWIVKYYDSIIAGKYKDKPILTKRADEKPNAQIVSKWTADEINAAFAKLNEEL